MSKVWRAIDWSVCSGFGWYIPFRLLQVSCKFTCPHLLSPCFYSARTSITNTTLEHRIVAKSLPLSSFQPMTRKEVDNTLCVRLTIFADWDFFATNAAVLFVDRTLRRLIASTMWTILHAPSAPPSSELKIATMNTTATFTVTTIIQRSLPSGATAARQLS